MSLRSRSGLLLVVALIAAVLPAGRASSGHHPMVFGVTMSSSDQFPDAEALAGTHPFVARIPITWTDPHEVQMERRALARAAAERGWRVLVNLRYRTTVDDVASDALGGFRSWVGSTVRDLADTPHVSFEISNRPNATLPDPESDAHDPLAHKALVAGVLAATDAVPGSRVGFSWLVSGVAVHDAAWWTALRMAGGGVLRDRVSFVGLQIFPGSQGPATPWVAGGPRQQVERMLEDTRLRYMPILGLGDEVEIVVGEFGAPTLHRGPPVLTGDWDVEQALQTPLAQQRVLRAVAEAVWTSSVHWGVTGATWTALSDPSEGCFVDRCWGLVTSTGSRRPAFDELRFHVGLASL